MTVYILQCIDDSYYIGVTNNLERRLNEHNLGYNEDCYTFTRRPVKLMWHEQFQTPSQAIQWEKRIKGWSRKKH
jgi:putative endonuclease